MRRRAGGRLVLLSLPEISQHLPVAPATCHPESGSRRAFPPGGRATNRKGMGGKRRRFGALLLIQLGLHRARRGALRARDRACERPRGRPAGHEHQERRQNDDQRSAQTAEKPGGGGHQRRAFHRRKERRADEDKARRFRWQARSWAAERARNTMLCATLRRSAQNDGYPSTSRRGRSQA